MEERTLREPEYVRAVLCWMRDRVSTNPKLFDPDAHERISEAIARVDDVLRSTRSQLTIGGV
jgi:hypothetical protein